MLVLTKLTHERRKHCILLHHHFGAAAMIALRPRSLYRQTGALSCTGFVRTAQRHASSQSSVPANPILERVKREQEALERQKPKSSAAQQMPAQGNLAPNSIFAHDASIMAEQKANDASRQKHISERNMAAIYSKIDPNPLQRRRWERKMVIRSIHKRGRLTKEQLIKRTERQSLSKSEWWRTSMKKLQPLATQIAGKTIEDAIVQMQFSKKKVAQDVKAHLEEARDRAIVERGMGLGKAQGDAGHQTVVRLKDDKRHTIKDQTGIYISEAWVGKGSYGKMANPRARGRIDVMKLPQTSMTPQLSTLHLPNPPANNIQISLLSSKKKRRA